MTTRQDRTGVERPPPTLTVRASLNALAAMVDYGARVVLQLVLAPLLLRFLGDAGYGAWQVLQRLIGHATPASGRPGEALKWVVAKGQSVEDDALKRRQVGTAITVWALFLPLVATLGGVLAWISPSLVKAAPDEVWIVRVAAGVLVVNLLVLGLASVPQAVLQGANLSYRRLGLSTMILVAGAGLTAIALWLGWGLVGVALATTATTVLSGFTYLYIVRGQVRWWGVARPESGAVRGFVGLSWWFLLWNLVLQAIKGSDVTVLGAIAGTSLVTVYTLTSYVPQAVSDLVFMVTSATMPGLGGLVGAGELTRAARVRGETMVLSWLVTVGVSASVVIWTPEFLELWVGHQYDAGTIATVLICVMVLQLALIRVDSNVIDLTLRIRAKVLLGLCSAVLAVGLGILLVGPAGLGIPGLVIGFVIGRLPLTVAYPVLVGKLLDLPRVVDLGAVMRPLLTSVLMVTGAVWLRPFADAGGWVSFLVLGALTAAATLAFAYVVGLSGGQRNRVRQRVLRVVHRS